MIQYGRMIGISLKSIEKKMSTQSSESNNKRISKNPPASLLPNASDNGCALFISKVVLDKLGVTDYGIYNAVG